MGPTLGRVFACYVAAMALVAACAGAASATIFTPNRFDDPSSGGTSCTPPAPPNGCSLRAAVQAAQTGDTVQLAAGTYGLTRAALTIPTAISLVGAGPGITTILQRGAHRAVLAADGASLSGLTVTGGKFLGIDGSPGTPASPAGGSGTSASGAGIEGGDHLTLTDVVVSHNLAIGGAGGDGAQPASGAGGDGGLGGEAYAVGIDAGQVTLTRVAVVDNVAVAGDGGSGANGAVTGNGGDGGDGGDTFAAGLRVRGGSMRDVLIAGNTVVAGSGGDGGGGASTTGQGGTGGNSGFPRGAGLYAQKNLALTNVTITGNVVESGNGGDGGTGSLHGGPGGDSIAATGGGLALDLTAEVQLASSTVAGDVTTGATGGNGGAQLGGTAADGASEPATGGNVEVPGSHLQVRDSIIAGGIADSPTSRNCALTPGGPGDQPLVSLGHNLEDGNDCFGTPAAGDIQNTPAGLGPLRDNGGPVPTMALLAGSAAINGGQSGCVDAAGQPLGADARGLQRATPCDIGAFEGQPPSASSPAVIGGTPAEGSVLSCAGAAFAGDPPITRSVQWLRDGTAIPGASQDQYTVSRADLGHALSCTVVGANIYGSATATSSAVKPPAPTPVLTALRLTPKEVRNGRTERVTFTLNTRARVTFVLVRAVPGIRAGSRCEPRGARRHGKRCTIEKTVRGGPQPVDGASGSNAVTWVPHGLRRGRYTLTAAPGGGSASKPLAFSVRR